MERLVRRSNVLVFKIGSGGLPS